MAFDQFDQSLTGTSSNPLFFVPSEVFSIFNLPGFSVDLGVE